MNRLQRTRLRLPIRLKLAVVSAGLTFAILMLFAVVVGTFTVRKITSSFDTDIRATTATLADRIRLRPEPTVPQEALAAAAAGGAKIRVLDRSGRVIGATGGAPELGLPAEGLRDVAGYRVASRPLVVSNAPQPGSFRSPLDDEAIATPVGFVQYAKPKAGHESTIARVKLFLGLGIVGGTALAFLAGLAIARRAMRPVTRLTSAAREIARTRDPAVTLPKPEAQDEVAELADTLEDMLRELGAARAETEAALARQREFVADASHELRTPLTSILANLELLETELGGEQAEIADSALRSSRRMRRLVADLLLLARADAGRQAAREPVDLARVAREAAAEAGPLTTQHPLTLDVPEAVAVEGVPDDLHRLMLNLIENAALHTPGGTPVTVSVRRRGDGAVIEVADRGPGVPELIRDRIFERFSRAGGDAGAGGSGLGLAIVRAVARSHGGDVLLDAAEGGGARFVVELPAGAAVAEPATPLPRRAAPSAGA